MINVTAERFGEDAIAEQVAWQTIGIVHGSGENKWKGIGTACPVFWNGLPLILTAEHVIRDTNDEDLRFFLRSNSKLQYADRSQLENVKGVLTKSLEPFQALKIGTPVKDRALDLAAIPVDSSLTEDSRVYFFPIEAGGSAPPVDTEVTFRGFPFDISRLTTRYERVAYSSTDWSIVVPSRSGLDSSFDPDLHFLAPYEAREQYTDADPRGFSGAGVWQPIRVPPPAVWYPKLDLAGIMIGYYRTSNVLQVVKREIVESFLRSHFG